MILSSALLFVVQKEFEEGGKLHGERVYLFGCTERKYPPLCGQICDIYV